MSLTKKFYAVANPEFSDVTDEHGRRDPLGAWLIDMKNPQRDVKGIFVNEADKVFIDSKKDGLISKIDYEDKNNLRFKVSGQVIKP